MGERVVPSLEVREDDEATEGGGQDVNTAVGREEQDEEVATAAGPEKELSAPFPVLLPPVPLPID